VLAERRPDHVPRRHQIRAVRGGDVNRRLQHVAQPRAGRLERHDQVRHHLPGLGLDVALADDVLVLVDRARTRREDQRARRGGGRVRVRDAAVEFRRADQFNCHSL